jgi:hypothetical protein
MTIDMLEYDTGETTPPLPWVLDQTANWKRSLSARVTNSRRSHPVSREERYDLASLYRIIAYYDKRVRIKMNLPDQGPEPEWVHESIDHRP